MKDTYFDFSKEPGKKLKRQEYDNKETVISIIMPFYNDKENLEQSVNSVLNQTFPCFELLIINDGSDDKESLKVLKEIEKTDERIKVINKENEGPAVARDYGVTKSSKTAKYLCFLDSDDLIDETYLECSYWTLETNKKASWAYADSIGFDGDRYLWNKYFNSDKLKKENTLVITAMIRKADFLEVGGYGLKEKSVYEDWNLWLKLIAKGKFPVRMNYYGLWYRRKKNSSELKKARENNERAMEIIRNTSKTIKKRVEAIQYPKYNYKWQLITEELETIPKIQRKKDSKTNILMIIPWMVMGGADKFNLEFIKRIDKNKFDVTIVLTEPAINTYRQEFEEYATVYDITTFLDQEYWISFINYIIIKNNINIIFNTNSEIGYAMLPYLKSKYENIPIIDYVHMEEWYNRNGGYSRDSSSVASVIDKTLVCNENSRKILIGYFGRNKEEVKTVYIGVDEEIYNPEKYNKEALKNKYDIPEGKYVISYICRISEQKRPFLLLEIVKEIKEKRKDCLFLVVGDGNLLAKMKSKAKKMELLDCIKFLGSTNKTDEIYAISDMTINCSIKEGLALTAYESLSMGIPVISSDVGGQKELINEKTGIIVPCMQDEEDIFEFVYTEDEINSYVKAIEKVIKGLDKYKKECRNRILKEFTVDQMAKNMVEIIEETLKNPNENKKMKNIDIAKELITSKFVSGQIKYEWSIKQYNNYYGFSSNDENYKFELFKEKMWQHRWYRGIIKLLQKTGIIKIAKNIVNQ